MHEHTGKLIGNAISQAPTKTQDTIAPSPTTIDTNIPDVNYTQVPHMNQIGHQIGLHPISLGHTTHKLKHFQLKDTKKHKQIHNLI